MRTELQTTIPAWTSMQSLTRAGRRPLICGAVLTLLLTMTTAGVATAKSVYVIASIVNFDAPIPLHVYDIGSDGKLTFQAEFGAPFIGSGMRGIAMDSNSGYLFCTYETSGFVVVLNATTLQHRSTLSVQDADNLAGIVYDHQKRLLYCADVGKDTLYVVDWNSLKGSFTAVLGSPFTLPGAEIYGIALDEYNDELYVASPSQGISVYSTWDWSFVRSMPAGQIALSVAVDPARDYVYYGGGFADNVYLTQRKISDWSLTKEVQVDPNAGVMGLGVDPDTGLVYLTTGRDNRPGGKDLVVFDTDLEPIQVIEDIGRPTGLVIPSHATSFNPLNLTKVVKNPLGGKANDDGSYYIVIGDEVTYTITFDDGGYVISEMSVVDKLPVELTFVTATGDGVYGRYDADTHTYTWENPPLTPGATSSLEIVCRLQSHTAPGQVVTNRVTIDSNKTPPTTIDTDAIATEATYNPLNIRKSVVSPEPTAADERVVYAAPGDEVAYHICFDNKSNDHATSQVVIVDALPQQAEFVRATDDGVYGEYDAETQTYVWIYPSLEAGDSNCVEITVRLAKDIPAGAVITNQATIKSDQTPQVSNGADVTVAYTPLDVSKTVISPTDQTDERGRPCVRPGESVTYAIDFRNPSPDVAVTQVTIVDELPPEVTFVSATGDRDYGSYDSIAHTYTWLYPLLAGSGQVRLELSVLVKAPVEPNTIISNIVTITSKQAAPSRARADAVVFEDPTVEGQMFLKPTQIWRNQSQTRPDLMVVVHLPEGVGMEKIADTPLVLAPGDAQSVGMKIFGSSTQGKILCFFDTAPILAATQGHGEFEIKVSGRLTSGAAFFCRGTISILEFGSR